jgi:putative glutamine amidotransferase
MVRRPVIGIATQTLEAQPGKLPRCWVMGQRYVRALTAAGAVPWLIPLLRDDTATLRAIHDQLDGLFLTGGVDIDPALYGEARHARCDRSDPDRDWTEMTLIRWALEEDRPILGVCRGIQAMNVACGGSLYQDVTDQFPAAIKHDWFPGPPEYSRDYLAHTVRVEQGSRLGGLLQAEQLPVNSMHHQGIKALASDFRASAYAPDGLIEGIEKPGASFVIGVQWHPEELAEAHAPMKRLFTEFVCAAASHDRGSPRS